MPFDNSVLLAIHKDFRTGLKFTDQTGNTIQIGQDPNWQPIPGTDNEGLLYDVPTGKDLRITFLRIHRECCNLKSDLALTPQIRLEY